jgi:hypothetical protein
MYGKFHSGIWMGSYFSSLFCCTDHSNYFWNLIIKKTYLFKTLKQSPKLFIVLVSHMECFILGSECWKFGSLDMEWPLCRKLQQLSRSARHIYRKGREVVGRRQIQTNFGPWQLTWTVSRQKGEEPVSPQCPGIS